MKRKIELEAERILLDRYDKYYRLAYSFVKNEHDALDIVQESAYKVLKEAKKIRDPGFLSTWIYRIVVNTSIDFLRKNKKERCDLDERELIHEDVYDCGEITELLNHLGEKERTVVILKYFEDMKLDEIAQVLNENSSTVKTRLYRALKKLKLEMEDDFLKKGVKADGDGA